MADISVTAANVLASATSLKSAGVAGATVTAGQPVYRDTANGNVLKPAVNNTTLLASTVSGIALNGAATGQPVSYVYDDTSFTPGAALTVGQVYTLSATAGGICPVADLVSTDYPAVLFVAKSATQAVLKIVQGGVAKP